MPPVSQIALLSLYKREIVQAKGDEMRKSFFRVLNAVILFLYRITGGRIGMFGKHSGLLLLTTIGRKSGKKRTLPLRYICEDQTYILVASYAGSPHHPAWYLNLKHHPDVIVTIGANTQNMRAEIASPEQRQQLWPRVLERAPLYGKYQQRTTREIPLVLLYPVEK
ncbi:nitroreductase [Thermosporothrix hazakensis]|jgi:deazaflavin-dependent oxidoreductase (nitroreductase family)|nr:nitroreductase [Thermosporothrix hazakensis]